VESKFVLSREKWENIHYRIDPDSNSIKVEVIGGIEANFHFVSLGLLLFTRVKE